MTETDPEQLVEFANSEVDRAVEATARSNPQADIDDLGDFYEFVAGVDDMPTYSIEIELHEFELMQLLHGIIAGMQRMQNADEMAFRASMVAKLAGAAPEHFDRLDELGAPDDAPPRGVQ